jgi:hypothetical protein
MATSGEQWAAGSHGFLSVLLHPSLIFGGTKSKSNHLAPGTADVVKVSCFLRGSAERYPKQLKQGTLRISGGTANWSPSFGSRSQTLIPGIKVQSVSIRAADGREPNVKEGGKELGVVAVPKFMVISCSTTDGILDLVVPTGDEPIVTQAFRQGVV